jgi:toxin ParE1/3/4
MLLVLREEADFDIERGFNDYMNTAGAEVATRFVMAIDVALAHITEFPGTGSPRYAELLDFPGLRFWLTAKFPFAVFYVEHDHHLDVIRVLHQHSDIPAQMHISDSDA